MVITAYVSMRDSPETGYLWPRSANWLAHNWTGHISCAVCLASTGLTWERPCVIRAISWLQPSLLRLLNPGHLDHACEGGGEIFECSGSLLCRQRVFTPLACTCLLFECNCSPEEVHGCTCQDQHIACAARMPPWLPAVRLLFWGDMGLFRS